MNEIRLCGNHELLIGYVYDECEPAEREAIASHLAMCASCAEEIQTLRDTRAHLGAWSPPAMPLGFQITRTDDAVNVLRPAAWWRQPLPAWAQVAAAVLIFAAGMSVSGFRSSDGAPAPAVAQAPAPAVVPVAETNAVDDMQVTRAEFARLEARLRSIENADVQLASHSGPGLDRDELFTRIAAIEDRILESDRNNLGSFARLARAVDAIRRDADASREATQRVNLMEEELQDHRQVLRQAIVPSGLAVPAAWITNVRSTPVTSGGR
jgi:hypothetical protein